MLDGSHLNSFENHVIGHHLALRVEDLGRSRQIHAGLQHCNQAEHEQLKATVLHDGVFPEA